MLQNDPDNRDPEFATTGDFSQHDFALSYGFNDNFQIRAGVVNAFDEEPARWLGDRGQFRSVRPPLLPRRALPPLADAPVPPDWNFLAAGSWARRFYFAQGDGVAANTAVAPKP